MTRVILALTFVLGVIGIGARTASASCGSDSDCAGNGTCSNGTCGHCGSDSDCKVGTCSSGHCGRCGSDSDCRGNGRCSNGKCGSCGSDSDCKGGRCSSGRCSNAVGAGYDAWSCGGWVSLWTLEPTSCAASADDIRETLALLARR